MTDLPDRPRAVGGIWLPSGAVLAVSAAAWVRVHGRPEEARAVAFAAAVCLLGTVASWMAMRPRAGSAAGLVVGPLVATALRLFPALAALGWLQTRGNELRAAGAGEWLVVFYLAMLAAEIARTMMSGRGTLRPPGGTNTI